MNYFVVMNCVRCRRDVFVRVMSEKEWDVIFHERQREELCPECGWMNKYHKMGKIAPRGCVFICDEKEAV